MYAETHAHTGFMEPAAHPKHNGNVTVVQPLYPTIGNTMRQSWWVFSGTVPKVSAGTVHGSTAWCWRELSPQTPTKKTAPLTTTHSWEEYIRTVEYRASGFMGVFGDISLRHLRCLCETSPATPMHTGTVPLWDCPHKNEQQRDGDSPVKGQSQRCRRGRFTEAPHGAEEKCPHRHPRTKQPCRQPPITGRNISAQWNTERQD